MSQVENSQKEISRELDQKLVELQSLFEMSQVLNSSLQLKSVLNNMLLTPMGRMMISRGMVLITDEQGGFGIQVLKGLPREFEDRKLYFESELKKPVLGDEFEKTPGMQFFKEQGLTVMIPIISTDRTVGYLCLGQKLGGLAFTSSEIDFLTSLSNIAATSIENALMFYKLKDVNRQLDKKIQELKTLFEIGQELNSTLETEKIVSLLVFAIMGEMLVNQCFVFLKNDDKMALAHTRSFAASEKELKTLSGKGFLKSLANISVPFLVQETELSRNLRPLQRLNLQVVVPMRIQDETKGVLVLGERISKKEFGLDDLEFLSTLSNQAMISIENARLFEEALEKQRMEEELNIAREIQQKLFPEIFPTLPGMEVKGLNIPSRQVGGDYYDCIRLDEEHMALTIADVSGKGVPASLLMSNLQAGLHSLVSSHADISAIAGKLNNFIQAHTNYDKFITFFYCEIDLKDRTLTYVNAGHNPPYIYHADGSHRILDIGGLILGMMPNMPYETEKVRLQKGDLVFMFTDGVTEAKSIQDIDFEEWRLEEILAKSLDADVGEVIDRIIAGLDEFSKDVPQQADDITMLALKVLE
ncbi:MAG: SpoIIE family protein phosphatase [Actinobacteria bacterium]|nr:SpoIIE family protein phosphatase [Actinomycetota bacterium]